MNNESKRKDSKPFADKIEGMTEYLGYYNFYWDEKEGKIWLEINNWEEEFLYVNALSAGLGSNDIGLDRNQLGKTRIVYFHRVGPKVLLFQPNYSYRALSGNPDEVKDVDDSFVPAVIWGFKVESEEEGRVLVDATEFLMRDEKDVITRLKQMEEGEYEVDLSKSAIWMPETKNFPLNTEFEVLLTYKGKDPGGYVTSVAVEPKLLTMRQHHSFIQLPDNDFQPRLWDPRSMFSSNTYNDYSTPVDQSIQKKFIRRHRLKKKDPKEEHGEAVEPIVYYVDRGVPEPIKSALVEGAAWWNKAFEAAGYKDAFRCEELPEGIDNLDVRYNIINWVHRTSRGWSYGSGINDPRTGEIIKGQVALGSLRIRHDFMIAEGLIADYEDGTETSEMMEMALARIRQLSVHEVGHTLGVGHNFASNVNGRSSVMDYPAMWVKIEEDGKLDLSDAYETGVGEWDKVYINFGYRDYPKGVDVDLESKLILDGAFEGGLLFAPGQGSGAAGDHPLDNPWVNGTDPVDELERIIEVRKIALDGFSERRIKPGTPIALLEEPLVTTYLYHRFSTEAACSKIGGLYYNHTIRGDTQKDPVLVTGDEQRRAIEIVLRTINPEFLKMPQRVLEIMPPRLSGLGPNKSTMQGTSLTNRDVFPGRTGNPFDPLGAAEAAANFTVERLLHHERAARVVEYHARNDDTPSFGEIIDNLIEVTWKKTYENGYHAELGMMVNNLVLYNLMKLASNREAAMSVRSVVYLKLDEIKEWLGKQGKNAKDESYSAHYLFAKDLIKLYQENPNAVKLTEPLAIPQGAPI